MHSQDWVKEMSEFAAAARVFRPLAGSIANRFTSSTSTVEGNMSATTPHHSDSLIIHTPAFTDAAGEAADMGMYGPLTRMILDFRPSHLLCKRVGIPVPRVYQKSSEQAAPESQVPGPMPFNYSAGSNSNDADLSSQSAEPSVPDPGVNKALEEERAAEEVFQAIFGDDG